jgi:DNA modification methylase
MSLPTPRYTATLVDLYLGECVEVMAELPAASVDAIVTDPPYGLGFMGKEWDRLKDYWCLVALRVLKPGAHLLAFGGTRTHHRLMVALEDAGFEIRDCLMWLYGQGFPKSRALGNGWGTALKPAWEPIILARKPLAEANVAANVLTYGTGGINVDGGRIEGAPPQVTGRGWSGARGYGHDEPPIVEAQRTASGRWPANLLLDEEAARLLDAQSEENQASRFFYTAKADREDRDGATHPTVKPLDLMAWLIKLITPPQGVVLDPFAGSGSTIAAARDLGIRSIGIERESAYLDMAIYRLRQEVLGL